MADQRNWRDASTLPSREGAPDNTTWAFGLADAVAQGILPGDTQFAGAPPWQAVSPEWPSDTAAGQQIVFIEGNVPDAQLLAAGVAPGVTAVILDPGQDGVQQIAAYLTSHNIQNLAAIDIVAHGADGLLQLGTAQLDSATIGQYQADLAAIGAALQPGGDIQLYGCDVAQDAAGDAFLQQLSQATGVANIAASSHLVGAADDGGNWNLNVDVGTADAATPFTAAAESAYPDVLSLTANQIIFATWNGGNSSTDDGDRVEQFGVSGASEISGSTIDLGDGSQSSYSGLNYLISGIAVDTAKNEYFAAVDDNAVPGGTYKLTIQEGSLSGTGGVTTVYTDPLTDANDPNMGTVNFAILGGMAIDAQTNELYYAQAAENYNTGSTDAAATGIYEASISGTGSLSPTLLTSTSAGLVNPDYIALDPSANLLFFTDSIEYNNGFPATDNLDEVNLSTGSVTVMKSFFNSGDSVDLLQGLALNGNTLYLTTVDYSSHTSTNNQILAIPFTVSGSGSTAKATVGTATTLYSGTGADQPTDIVINAAQGIFYTTGEQYVTTGEYYGAVYEGSLSGGSSLTEVLSMSTIITNGDAAQNTDPVELVLLTQPTIAASGTVTAVSGGSAVTVDSGVTVSDPDGQNLASATIAGVLAGDTLSYNGGAAKVFGDGFTITSSFSGGALTLSGNASPTDYQTALDAVTFSTTSTSATPRTIDWTVNDGVVSSATETSTVDVHVAPGVTAGATATFDGGGSPVALDSGLTVSDASSSTLVGASVTIVSETSTDRLNFTNQNGISGSYSSGVLTLTGNATVGEYQTALESITYSVSPTDSDPTDGGSDTSRTIHWTVNDGVLSSSVVTSTVDAVHVAPTITAGGTVTFDGGGSAVALDPGLTVTDVDSGNVLSSATVTIAGAITGDTLNFTNAHPSTEGNIAVSSDSNGVLVLTSAGSTATVLQWETALESVTYSFNPSDGDPTGGGSHTSRTISWSVNDGVATSTAATSTLDIVHAPPSISAGAAPTPTFDGGGSPVTLDSGVTAADGDSGGDLAKATVIIGGYISGDTLTVGTPDGLGVSFSNGTLTLSGTANVAAYNTALDSVEYGFTAGGDPTGGGSHTTRTISWSVNDGVATSTTATSTVDVVHTAPTITAGGTVTFDGGGRAVALDPGLTVTDVDSGGVLSSATVMVAGAITGDTLNFTNAHPSTEGNIGVSSDSNGVLVLTSVGNTATVLQWETALESVTYSFNPSDGDPTGGGSDTSRTIDWVVSDGNTSNGTSNTSTSTLDTVHEQPTVTAGGTVDFTGGSGAQIALDSGLVLADPDSNGNIVSATVTVGGYITGDTLSVGTAGGLTTSFSDGTLTLSGTATIGTYQAALDSVDYTFTPTDGDPTGGGSDTSRTISWSVNDGVATGSGSSTLDVIHVAPTVVAGGSATYPENGAPVALDPGLTASDPDSGGNLTGATVSISDGFLVGDALDFTNQDGITGSYDAGTGTLTLTGTEPIGDYESALQSVAYSFSGDPTDGGTDDSRTITWSVTDSAASSAPETSSLTVLCFCKGTRIATPDGQKAVELLAVGDRVLTASNAVREITWIGEGSVLATRGRRNAATPVIVSKHAIARNVPNRDLRITKAHGLFFDGVLIPVEFLVNHRSIRWDDRAQEVKLYHIELETHDVLLANGAPAESYRDDGNRWLFRNANSGWHLPPKPPCVPVLTGGDIVDAVWRRLLDRSGPRHMPPLTDEPDLHLLVDGRRVDAVEQRDQAYVFRLPQRPDSVRIVSRDAVPAELGLVRDPRSLGVALRRIVACQGANFTFVEAADPRLVQGYHAFEPTIAVPGEPLAGIRWTTGDAVLPADVFAGFAGPFELVLHLGGRTQYIADEEARRAA